MIFIPDRQMILFVSLCMNISITAGKSRIHIHAQYAIHPKILVKRYFPVTPGNIRNKTQHCPPPGSC
jgi:hypothetical protein